MLPGQWHPEHWHTLKDETFHILHGEIDLVLGGASGAGACKNDVVVIQRGVKHEFRSCHGGRDRGDLFDPHSKGRLRLHGSGDRAKYRAQDLRYKLDGLGALRSAPVTTKNHAERPSRRKTRRKLGAFRRQRGTCSRRSRSCALASVGLAFPGRSPNYRELKAVEFPPRRAAGGDRVTEPAADPDGPGADPRPSSSDISTGAEPDEPARRHSSVAAPTGRWLAMMLAVCIAACVLPVGVRRRATGSPSTWTRDAAVAVHERLSAGVRPPAQPPGRTSQALDSVRKRLPFERLKQPVP
jgi:hypothetical protein